ncbi:MAG: PfaD family polyunsaturated fatty acid/polyketide biosynthesis protein [Pseudomonadota bacterium]
MAEQLGSAVFRARHGLRYAYVAGAMYRGVASTALVVRMGQAGCIGYLGTGGMPLAWIESALAEVARSLPEGQPWGANLLANYSDPQMEDRTVDLLLRAGVQRVEAAAFMQMTPALVRWRLAGLRREADGRVRCAHHVLAKVSRPEVAEAFMRPAPEGVVAKLLAQGMVTPLQAELARQVPMAHDICVEADSGGHTDGGVASVLMSAMLRLRERVCAEFAYAEPVCLGLAGGIGAPEAAAAAFVMGADFILTGSINQCTADAGMSEDVKDMLQQMNVQDTDYAPAGDMFETGARVQVLRRGVFFPVRANRLYALFTQYDSLDEIPEKLARQVQDSYFKRSFAQVWAETQDYLREQGQEALIAKAESHPKQKMALVFRWYFGHSTAAAFAGRREDRVDYQVQTGPALGAFNQWVKGTPLEPWRARHADAIGIKLMTETAHYLGERFGALLAAGTPGGNKQQ